MGSPNWTSVPDWARTARTQPADPTGRVHTVVEVSAPGTQVVVAGWCAELAERQVRRHHCHDLDDARAVLRADLSGARVGHRLLVTGTAEACLLVRAAALDAGMVEEEIRVGVVSVATRSVWCAHCAATTSADAAPDDVVTCRWCGRGLLVYAHVSRRTGRHLGFMHDAETALVGGAP